MRAPAHIGDLRVVADEASPRCPRIWAGRRASRIASCRSVPGCAACRSWWAGTAECRADGTRAAPAAVSRFSRRPRVAGWQLMRRAGDGSSRRRVTVGNPRAMAVSWATPPTRANRSTGLATALPALFRSASRRIGVGIAFIGFDLGGRPGSCCLAQIQEGAEMVMGSGARRAIPRRSGRVCEASRAIHRGVIG
jgi:hypothetical protein